MYTVHMIDPQIEAPLQVCQPQELMVYLHLPFCSTRCGYCDFYSETDVSEQRIAATLQGMLGEAEWYRRIYPNARVSSLYLGGGTPSLIPSKLLSPFLTELSRLFAPSDMTTGEFEWSFEANPESLNAEKLEILAESGVSRLSLGVQSFDDRFLRALDRQADGRMVRRALEEVQDSSRFQLSLDLMTGLPGQTHVDVITDAEQLLSYTPEHISLYSLTVEEGTALARQVKEGLVRLGAPAHRDMLWEAAARILRRNGYRQYEISNFCLPGKHARHNSGYWRGSPYLGLGPGAVGTLPFPAGVRAVRITNPGLHDYLRAAGTQGGAAPAHALEYLSGKDLLLERFLMGLRTREGVQLASCAQELGVELTDLHSVLESWEGAGHLDRRRLGSGSAALRHSGRMILDRLLPDLAVRLESLSTETGDH